MKKLRIYLIAACLLLALAGCGQPVVDTRTDEPATIEAHTTVYGKIREANGNEIIVALLNYNEASAPGSMGGDMASGGAPGGEAAGPAGGAPSDATATTGRNISPPAGAAGNEGNSGEAPTGRILTGDPGAGGEAPAGGRGQRMTSGESIPAGESGTVEPAPADEAAGTPGGRDMFPSVGEGAPAGGRGGPGMIIMGGVPTGNAYTLTGEDATFLIPVTAVITSGEGDAARTVRFTQLSYKNVIKISLDAEGNVFAIQVLE